MIRTSNIITLTPSLPHKSHLPHFLLQIRTNNLRYRRQQIAIMFMSIFKQFSPRLLLISIFLPKGFLHINSDSQYLIARASHTRFQ